MSRKSKKDMFEICANPARDAGGRVLPKGCQIRFQEGLVDTSVDVHAILQIGSLLVAKKNRHTPENKKIFSQFLESLAIKIIKKNKFEKKKYDIKKK